MRFKLLYQYSGYITAVTLLMFIENDTVNVVTSAGASPGGNGSYDVDGYLSVLI